LTIPGVQVRTQFEPAPVLPGATGILGVVGVTDRGPVEPTPVGSFGEFLDIFGTGSSFTMPEVRGALANGVFQVVVARTSPGKGNKAKLTLTDGDRTASLPNGEPIATLEARAEGTWGNAVGVRVEQILTAGGDVKYINVETSLGGVVVDRLKNLVMDETSPNYFFDVINESSRLVVAYDPLFETGLPSAIARTALASLPERAAFATLTTGASGVVKATAKRAGRAGNRIAVQVTAAPAGRRFDSAAGPSIDVRARPGVVGTNLTAAITAAATGVNLVITSGGTPRSITGTSVDELVANAATDAEVEVVGLGADLPSVSTGGLLTARRNIAVLTEGRDTRHYENLGSRDEITAISDTGVVFTPVGAASLPDTNDGVPLTAGRDAGAALALIGEAADEPMLELVPAADVSAALEVVVKQSTTAPTVTFEVLADGEVVETFEGLVMDPDDPQYAPDVLEDSSAFIRAHDLFVRTHTTSFPRALVRPAKLAGGASPTPDDYQEALDRLEGAEEVDLVIASVASQLAPDQIRTVHQSVVAHCTKMADVARNRIGLGSVTGDAVAEAIDHANDVRSDHFVLSTPARSEAALAGLLGRQDYFQSPTFKTIASLGVPPGAYTDAQLTQLINDNVCVVNERRRVGIIVVKGVLTSGRQINVQRTANKSVRDVKAIADKYIGLLNNEGSRNALKQQITALLLQMERDGALVPSTDGTDPAFRVDVYSTQADFANAIVRVDIAVRPVRAIDFIYATILVKN
jgi:hypothetical protein